MLVGHAAQEKGFRRFPPGGGLQEKGAPPSSANASIRCKFAVAFNYSVHNFKGFLQATFWAAVALEPVHIPEWSAGGRIVNAQQTC